MSCLHEWCAPEVARFGPRLQRVPLDTFSWSTRRLLRGETLLFERASGLPDEAVAERHALHASGVRSLAATPLAIGGEVVGALLLQHVVEERDWTPSFAARFEVVSDILSGALHRLELGRAFIARERLDATLKEVSTHLVRTPDSDDALVACLASIAEAHGFARAAVVRLPEEAKWALLTHAWCEDGLLADAPTGPLSAAPVEALLARLPPDRGTVLDARALHPTLLERLGMRSSEDTAVVIPLVGADRPIGLLAFHAGAGVRDVSELVLSWLAIVAGLLAKELHRPTAPSEDDARFAQVVRSSPHAWIVTDARGTMLDWSPGATTLLGPLPGLARGRNLAELLPTVDARDELAAALKRSECTRIETLEVRLHGPDEGRERVVALAVSPSRWKGARLRAVLVRDITEPKRREDQCRQAFSELAQQTARLEVERDHLRQEIEHQHGDVVGQSAALRRVLEHVDAVATTGATVLIRGESGVGKELVARAIHERSGRADGPLVKVNCACIPRELFESEFFGHAKGAFTGAHRERVGRFELADGGTLFLDEVGEIPLALQAKLLRVLQERELERIGDDQTRAVDVRVIAASNRPLDREVEAGRFRQDLYYRLAVFPIEVPPLRARPEDIRPLAEHFLAKYAGGLGRPDLTLSSADESTLMAYAWPGNVRELQNVMERAAILSPEGILRLDRALPAFAAAGRAPDPPALRPLSNEILTETEMKSLEQRNIVAALEHCGWRIAGETGAAALLGMKPSTLRGRMKALRIARS